MRLAHTMKTEQLGIRPSLLARFIWTSLPPHRPQSIGLNFWKLSPCLNEEMMIPAEVPVVGWKLVMLIEIKTSFISGAGHSGGISEDMEHYLISVGL